MKVVVFYYNVWKVRGCEEAKAWYNPGYRGLGKDLSPVAPQRQPLRQQPPARPISAALGPPSSSAQVSRPSQRPPHQNQPSRQQPVQKQPPEKKLHPKASVLGVEDLLGTLRGIAKGSVAAATVPSITVRPTPPHPPYLFGIISPNLFSSGIAPMLLEATFSLDRRHR
jgi:hypothetical protein